MVIILLDKEQWPAWRHVVVVAERKTFTLAQPQIEHSYTYHSCSSARLCRFRLRSGGLVLLFPIRRNLLSFAERFHFLSIILSSSRAWSSKHWFQLITNSWMTLRIVVGSTLWAAHSCVQRLATVRGESWKEVVWYRLKPRFQISRAYMV